MHLFQFENVLKVNFLDLNKTVYRFRFAIVGNPYSK